jgi:hypothetical protein
MCNPCRLEPIDIAILLSLVVTGGAMVVEFLTR